MTEPTEKDLIATANRLRRESEHTLDELTIARLRAARLNAIAASRRSRYRFWGFAGGAAAAGLALAIAGTVWLKAPSELPAAPANDATLADLDLLTTESPDFYGNLEFYRWLASQSDAS